MKNTTVCEEFGIYKEQELESSDQTQCDALIMKKCPYHNGCCTFINTVKRVKEIIKRYYNYNNEEKIKLLKILFIHKTSLKLEKMYVGESNFRLYKIADNKFDIGPFYFLKPENAELVYFDQFKGNDNHFFLYRNLLTMNPDSRDSRQTKFCIGESLDFIAEILFHRKNIDLLKKQIEKVNEKLAINKKLVMNFSVFKIPEKHEPTSLFNLSADKINDQKYSNELFKKFPTRMLLEDKENNKVKLLTNQEEVNDLLIGTINVNVEDIGRYYLTNEFSQITRLHIDNDNIREFVFDINKKLLHYQDLEDLKIGYSISLYVY